jgi:hypothetical protein
MTAKRKAAGAGRSQRERLLGRPRPSLPYPILVADMDGPRQELDKVLRTARQAMIRADEGTPEHAAAVASIEAAQAAVDACYETVTLRALPPAGYEQLKADHPPTAGQVAEAEKLGIPPPDANVDTLVPEALAAGCDNGMTVEDWATFLAEHCGHGERQELRTVVLGLNEATRFAESTVLPKGSTGIRSSRWS